MLFFLSRFLFIGMSWSLFVSWKKEVHYMLLNWMSLLNSRPKKRKLYKWCCTQSLLYFFPTTDKHDWLAVFAHVECTGFCSLPVDWRHTTKSCDTWPHIVLLLNKHIQPPSFTFSTGSSRQVAGTTPVSLHYQLPTKKEDFFQLHPVWCSYANTSYT